MTAISIMHDHLIIIAHRGHHHSDVRNVTHFGPIVCMPIIRPSLVMIRQKQSSIHHSSFRLITFLMTDDPETDHHATASYQKMTYTIVFRDTKGGANI